MMRKLIALFLLFATAPIGAQPGSLTGGQAPATLSLAGIHVSGNRIVNSLGQGVSLRGVNKSGTEYQCLSTTGTAVFDGPADASDVANLTAWGVNIVRLPLNEQCWLGINSMPRSNYTSAFYQNAIVNYVNLLSAANIATIIDLQWAAPGVIQAGTGAQPLIPVPDLDHAPAFWTSVANTFKNNSRVLFDLYNEPYPDNNQNTTAAWTCLRDGCLATYPNDGSTYTSVGTQSLVNTIRATGATNIIMVPGVQFTNVLAQWVLYKPTDSANNLVASWHSYSDQICVPQSCWDSQIAPVLANAPLITGELGERDCAHTYVDPLMVWLDARYGHYLGWAWNTYNCSSFPSLIADYSGTPTSFGVGMRDHFLAAQGLTPPVQPPLPYFNNGVFPYGISVGSNSSYLASDGVTYFADVAASGLDLSMQFFIPYTTNHSITGTPDPTLFQSGRYGNFGIWTINVPNGTYTVTLSAAPVTAFTQSVFADPSTASINNAGEFGQDQAINGNVVRACAWSSFSGTNDSPYSPPDSGGTHNSCLRITSTPVPSVDAAVTYSYTITTTNQQLKIQTSASFGGGRKTILNAIRIDQQSIAPPPTIPTGLAATGGNAQVSLSWNTVNGASFYNIYRGLASRGFFRQIAQSTTTSYVDLSVLNNKTYYYIISAGNATGVSGKTSVVSATPTLPPPSAPTGVGASSGSGQVVISWTASSGATSYNVKRSLVNGGPYSTIGSVSISPYVDSGLTNGTTYYYVVSAVNACCESANSAQVSGTPVAGGATGVWTNVTPGNVVLLTDPGCGNFGIESVGADTTHPGTLYFEAHCQGLWKSTDYGITWSGPINTGTNGSSAGNCAGGITVVPTANLPTIYETCIRGSVVGLWRSIDGGVNWVNLSAGLTPPLPSGRPDIYPVSVDPYNNNHLLACGHEQNFLIESTDGGVTWVNKTMPTNPSGGGTAFTFFIDDGNATTTANHWLWIMQGTGGGPGTYITTNGAASWTNTSNINHPHGDSQIYQPDKNGVVYEAGTNSTGIWGVYRSTDYGLTWTHVGSSVTEALVWGTSKNVYSIYGWSAGSTVQVQPNFISAPQPGITGWANASGAPANFLGGPHQVAVVNDGSHNVFLGAMGNSGVWRYIEP